METILTQYFLKELKPENKKKLERQLVPQELLDITVKYLRYIIENKDIASDKRERFRYFLEQIDSQLDEITKSKKIRLAIVELLKSNIIQGSELQKLHLLMAKVGNIKLEKHNGDHYNDEYLGKSPNERMVSALERLDNDAKETFYKTIFPRVGLLCNGEYIQNEQMDVIKKDEGYIREARFNRYRAAGLSLDPNQQMRVQTSARTKKIGQHYHISFRMTPGHYRQLRDTRFKDQDPNSLIWYTKKKQKMLELTGMLEVSYTWSIKRDGITINVASGDQSRYQSVDDIELYPSVGASIGLTEVIIPAGHPYVAEGVIGEKLNALLKEELEIQDALDFSSEEQDEKLKQQILMTHDKLEHLPTEEQISQIERKEVMPDYFAYTKPEEHLRMWDKSPFAVFHQIYTIGALVDIIKYDLLSLEQRYKRGLFQEGLGMQLDLHSGGALSIFTRIATKEGCEKSDSLRNGIYLIFAPTVINRMDKYMYNEDRSGSTAPEEFAQRLTIDETFEDQKENGYNKRNEMMFNHGLPFSSLIAIGVSDERTRKRAITVLKKNDVYEIGVNPVGHSVLIVGKTMDLVEITKNYVEQGGTNF